MSVGLMLIAFTVLMLGILVSLRIMPRFGFLRSMFARGKGTIDLSVKQSGEIVVDGANVNDAFEASEKTIDTQQTVARHQKFDPILNEFNNDPTLTVLLDVVVRKKATIQKLLWLLDKTEIWFGVSTGLLGMALATIAYNFIDQVIINKQLFAAISYGIFLLAFSNGLYRYWSRKNDIKRLENDLDKERRTSQETVEALRKEHSVELNKLFEQLIDGQSTNDHVLATNEALFRRNTNLNEKYQLIIDENRKLKIELERFRRSKKFFPSFRGK